MKCTNPKGEDFDCDIECMDKFFGMPSRDADALLDYVVDLEKKVAACGKK